MHGTHTLPAALPQRPADLPTSGLGTPVDPRELSETLMEKLGEGSEELVWTVIVALTIRQAFPNPQMTDKSDKEEDQVERYGAHALLAIGLAVERLAPEPPREGSQSSEQAEASQDQLTTLRRVLNIAVGTPPPYGFVRLWAQPPKLGSYLSDADQHVAQSTINGLRTRYYRDGCAFTDPAVFTHTSLNPLAFYLGAVRGQLPRRVSRAALQKSKLLAIDSINRNPRLSSRQRRFALHYTGLRHHFLCTTDNLFGLNLGGCSFSAVLLFCLWQATPLPLAIFVALCALPAVFALCLTINIVHGHMTTPRVLNDKIGIGSATLDPFIRSYKASPVAHQASASLAVGSSSFAATQPAGTPAAAAGTDDAEAGAGDAAQEDAIPSSTLPGAGQ